MHQQQQNIIHVISHDNAQNIKIERPAPLSLHLKLHWNYNQQLLQGEGKENKGRQKKEKIHGGFFCSTQKNPVPPSLSCLVFLDVNTNHRESQDWILHRSSGSGRFRGGCFRTCSGWRSLTFSPGSLLCTLSSLLSRFEAIVRWYQSFLDAFQQDFSTGVRISCRIFPPSFIFFFFFINQKWLRLLF